MRDDKVRAALDLCYDAVVSPELWSEALQQLASALGSAAMMFYPFQGTGQTDPRDTKKALAKVPTAHGYQELIEEYERNQWYLGHYRAQRGLPLLLSGQSVVIEHQLASDEERRRSRHYNELYLRFGFAGYSMINVPLAGQRWCIPMVRSVEQGHFTPDDAANLARYVPQFRRLISLSNKLEETKGLAVTSGLGAINAPAILLDWRGKVVSLNPPAEAMLQRGFNVVRGELIATNPASNRALQAMVRCALQMDRTAIENMLPSTLLQRRLGRPVLAEVLPLSGVFLDIFSRAHVLLLLTDLDRFPAPEEKRLRLAFSLSPAEARLAVRLAGGTELRDAANEIGISYETSRTHLRAIFAKTGTRRQGELIALLSRIERFR